MNENIIDVLIYIYETYMDGDQQLPADQIIMEEQLLKAGFHEGEISKAFDWLDELAWRQGTANDETNPNHASIRIYTEEEQQRLDIEIRGLLMVLEQNGIISPASRELIIERAMALGSHELDTDDIKWISLLVLMNQPGHEAAFTIMQDLIYDGIPESPH